MSSVGVPAGESLLRRFDSDAGVGALVLQRVGPPVVAPPTDPAAVALLRAVVGAGVLQEGGAVGEPHLAALLRADERLLLLVDHHVVLQRGLPLKGAPADGAAERALRGVGPLVLGQAGRPLEACAALAADERVLVLVHHLVLCDIPLKLEALATYEAGVRPLVRVDQFVLDEVSRPDEALVTRGALVWPFTCVYPQVLLEDIIHKLDVHMTTHLGLTWVENVL